MSWVCQRPWHFALGLGVSVLTSGCFSSEKVEAKTEVCQSAAVQNPPYVLSGRVQYGYVPTQAIGSYAGKLDYSNIALRPARRVLVQALDNCGTVVTERATYDDGTFTLAVPGNTVSLSVAAQLKSGNYAGTGFCNGATWDVKVVDNTRSKAIWTYKPQLSFSQDAQGIAIDIPLAHNGSVYTNRAAAPFALVDTAVSAIEKVCQASPDTDFPSVLINWSPENRPVSGEKAYGQITTSHFTVEAWDGVALPQLYILGKEGVDTDEYDDHVVAHEFGHYLENSLYRSDTIGGSHGSGDMLDPRVAFGEGYGNAFSGMTFNNPTYIDTYGFAQGNGFSIQVAQAPGSLQNRGIHSEASAQYLLWKLYDNMDGVANSGSYLRIDDILRNFQKTTPAFTSLQSFASYYNAKYGSSAQQLQSLWSTGAVGLVGLDLPYHSLCPGSCLGSGDVADPFDADVDLGNEMDGTRTYGITRDAAFWNPYRVITPGMNGATGHDVIDAGPHPVRSYLYNKLGYVRWYRYHHELANAAGVRVDVALGGGKSCGIDYTDMVVYHKGTIVASDWGFGGCPSVQWIAQPGQDYVITVDGLQLDTSGAVPSFSLTVTR